ncbi:hypothetical protein NP493_528g02000 [Ridgeia piscesae]|uniref:Uncharacterized protein n=1 Tax=Ridgeia piscesae TaxID=27915 RepID=A0AAD9KWR7_RIDPI|nr:hypothetical protein NP493_528g02000 [Ridgeia piscesae]
MAKQYDKNKHCCVIDARLFQQMFGEDVRLLESPVLLVSTPDGAVFSLSLKCTLGKQELHIVCHLQEPVVDVISFSEDTGAVARTTMLFVGRQGKVISARGTDGQDRNVRFCECAIAGPVDCLTVHNQHLVYSAGRHVCHVPLCHLTETDCHGQCIQGGSVGNSRGCGSRVSVCHVMQHRGSIMHVNVPVKSTVARPVTTHRIKDLLNIIGHLADQRDAIQKTLKHQGATLEQLSAISHIAAQERTISVVVHHCRLDVIDMCVLSDAHQMSLDVTPKQYRTNYEELLCCGGDRKEAELNHLRQYSSSVNICHKETGGLTETMMLQKLLGKTSNENVPNSCRLHRLPNGHSVVLSVHLTADHYTATISTKDVCTLVLMRTAIMDRIQTLDTELGLLGDSEGKQSTSEQQKLLVDVYLKLQQVFL